MKLFVVVVIFALHGCANEDSLTPELKVLRGHWVSVRFIQDVQRTKSPHTAWFSEPPTLSFSIGVAQDGSGYELARTNFHEGQSSRILGLERAKNKGAFRLSIDAPNLSEGIDYVQLRVERGLFGQVTHLNAANLWDGDPEQQYLRLPVTLAQYIDRIILAGTYKDSAGATYSFSESGEARWPDQSFQYEISLDPAGAGCDYFEYPDRNGVGGRKRYGYRWRDQRLELYNINYVDTEKCTICCDPEPFATLHQSN